MLTMTHDFVLIEPLEAIRETPGGVLLPDTAQGKLMAGRVWHGKVLAVGPGRIHTGEFGGMPMSSPYPCCCQVGDTVALLVKGAEYEAALFGGGDQKWRIVHDEEIMGVLPPTSVPTGKGK